MLTNLSLAEWQEFAASHCNATVFHHRNWLELIRDHYGYRVLIPAVKRGERIRAALPFLEVRKLWGRKAPVSLPFTDCIQVLAEDRAGRGELLQALRSHPNQHYRRAQVRTDRPFSPGSRALWVRSQVDLAGGLEVVAGRYPRNLRLNVAKARSHGLQFEKRSDRTALDEFYRLHVLTRKRLGVPVQTKAFFNRLYERIVDADLGYLGLITKDNTVLASGLFLHWNKLTVYKYAASDFRATRYRPNDLLVHESIRVAAELGHTGYDFGISCKSHEGLRRFKRKWGAVETDVFREYTGDSGRYPDREPQVFKLASLAIQSSPAVVCRLLGAVFYKYSQ